MQLYLKFVENYRRTYEHKIVHTKTLYGGIK
jgi:hypothetical protein